MEIDYRITRLCGMMFCFALFVPLTIHAKTSTPAKPPAPKAPLFEISGWIPYWRTATGTVDALTHLDTFKEINPFGYTVKNNGSLFDALHVATSSWQILIDAARKKNIRVIPTVMWSNTQAIHNVLKNKKLRNAHIKEIVAIVKKHGFDGIDIDYESKKADTKEYFSIFLRDLYKAMGKKWVMCTIEARTPLHARFDTIPKDIRFANDYVAINKYCDRVRIMTYDQQSIDLRLNEAAPESYAPVADPQWVEKVITLAAKTIAKKKIIIGVATYGYEYDVTPLTEGYRYDRLWAFNPKYAFDLAAQLGVIPQRNAAGEMSFSYVEASVGSVLSGMHDTAQVHSDDVIASSLVPLSDMAAPIVARTKGNTQATSSPFRLLWWSDARAIKDKIDLAKKLGVRGIAIFKIDGGEDPALWDVLDAIK